jgi:hypothetical protein
MNAQHWRATPLAAGAPRWRDWDETARVECADSWSAWTRLWAIGRFETEVAQANLYTWLSRQYPQPPGATLAALTGAHLCAADLLEELTYPQPPEAEDAKRGAVCARLARVAARAGLEALDRRDDAASAAVLVTLERECAALRLCLLGLGGAGR